MTRYKVNVTEKNYGFETYVARRIFNRRKRRWNTRFR